MTSPLSRERDRERMARAAGMVRAAATGARWVDEGQTRFILVPLVTINRVIELLERTSDDGATDDTQPGGKERPNG